jgi:hypothetical protein
MTNLEIIKYLATNNPTRLAGFLNKICYDAWDFGRLHRARPITDWDEWLQSDPKTSCEFNSKELEQWSKAINPTPTIEATYGNLSVTFPVTDPDHMWNKNNDYDYKMETVETAIDELKLVETLVNVDKYSDSVYNSFRKEVCAGCNDPNCLRSKVEIYDCHKFENYFEI